MLVIAEIELSKLWFYEVGSNRPFEDWPLDVLKMRIAEGIGHRGKVLSVSFKNKEKGGE